MSPIRRFTLATIVALLPACASAPSNALSQASERPSSASVTSGAAMESTPSAEPASPPAKETGAQSSANSAPAQEPPKSEPSPAPQAPARRSRMIQDDRIETSAAATDKLVALPSRDLAGHAAEERARAAFAALSEKEQRELLDYLTLECRSLGGFQRSLIDYVEGSVAENPRLTPLIAPLSWFETSEHAPAQIIPRAPLDAAANEVQAVCNTIHGAAGQRRADSGWIYDYALRALRRLPHEDDPRRVFENALIGLPPGWDLAEAWIEMQLDDGSQQKAAEAFGHAYTDRQGGVYPGVTLYDAHASRTSIEMPDVDALGLVHTLSGDWTTWKAMVPAQQQAPLYARVAELFAPLFRHRSLRENLARTFVCGTTELRDGYQANLDNFHALWESCSSDPARLREKLPNSDGWRDFLAQWGDRVAAERELMQKATERRATLDRDLPRVRATLLRVLGEVGAFARIEKPPEFR